MAGENQWEVAGTSPSGTPATQWEVDKTADAGPERPGVSRPKVNMETSTLPTLVRGLIGGVPPALGTVGGAVAGAGLGPAGSIAGAGLGAAAGETASQALENKVFGTGVSPTSKEGLKRTGMAGLVGAGTEGAFQVAPYIHPIEGMQNLAKVKALGRFIHAPETAAGTEKLLIGPEARYAPATDVPTATPGTRGIEYGPREGVQAEPVPKVGAQEKIVVKPGFGPSDVRPGARGRLLVSPGTEANEAAESAATSGRGGVDVIPEPTKKLIGGEKTAFSLPLGKPLDSAVNSGNSEAGLIRSVRTGRPVIIEPREGTGYPGPREPLVERRSSARPELMSPTDVENALKNRTAIKTPFDVTEGANATIARDVDRRVGPAPGAAKAEPIKIEFDKDNNITGGDGRHRIMQAIKDGKQSITVVVKRGDKTQVVHGDPKIFAKMMGVDAESLAATDEQQRAINPENK